MILRRMGAVRRASLFALDLCFPNRCGCCGDFIRWDQLLCEDCQKELNLLTPPDCCAAQLDCTAMTAAYPYSGRARDGVLTLKNGGNGNFAEVLALILAERIRERQAEFVADYIVPVPATRSTVRARGYNQAALLAKELSRLLQIPVREDCLVRREGSLVQHTLDARAREENAGGYQGCGKKLNGCSILLCDDVVTTGATARRCAQQLRGQGASAVMLLAGTVTERRETEHGHRN